MAMISLTDYYLIIPVVALIIIYFQHKKDLGSHKSAKVWHSIAAIIFLTISSRAIMNLTFFLFRHQNFMNSDIIRNDLMSSEMFFVLMLISNAATAVAFMTCFAILFRKDNTRKLFIYLLPISALFEVIVSGSIMFSLANIGETSPLISIVLVAFTQFGIAGLYIFLYTRPFMINFFQNKVHEKVARNDSLDGDLLQ